MNISHYSVFAAAPGGGKHVAVVEGVDNPVDMGKIAAESGAPLTGFILESEDEYADARFFSPTKAKGSSDSGALVIAEHLRLRGAIKDCLFVLMGSDELQVSYQNGKWWREPENAHKLLPQFAVDSLLDALRLNTRDVVGWGVAGNSKINSVIEVSSDHLHRIKPKFEALAASQNEHNLNGVLVFSGESPAHMRFFSPAKGLEEDNAGSFTAVSLCGYLAQRFTGAVDLEVLQGESMGKPSKLYAEFMVEDEVAANVHIGGQVEMLEVNQWA